MVLCYIFLNRIKVCNSCLIDMNYIESNNPQTLLPNNNHNWIIYITTKIKESTIYKDHDEWSLLQNSQQQRRTLEKILVAMIDWILTALGITPLIFHSLEYDTIFRRIADSTLELLHSFTFAQQLNEQTLAHYFWSAPYNLSPASHLVTHQVLPATK